MRREEQEQQIILVDWCRACQDLVPQLGMIYHIPNGGKRTKVEAAIMKKMGVKPGVPDLFLAARGMQGEPGLYIEMKAPKERPRPTQKWWLEALTKAGYVCAVCRSWMEGAHMICAYLGIAGGYLDPLRAYAGPLPVWELPEAGREGFGPSGKEDKA